MAGSKSRLHINVGQGFSLVVGLPTLATWTTATRPKNAKKGTFGFNSQTNSLEFWTGTDWLAAHMDQE